MMIVSIVFVLPVGGPVVLATYIIIKKTKKDEKGGTYTNKYYVQYGLPLVFIGTS